MKLIFENFFNGYRNYPVIIGVAIFCLYALVAPPIIKILFKKYKWNKNPVLFCRVQMVLFNKVLYKNLYYQFQNIIKNYIN